MLRNKKVKVVLGVFVLISLFAVGVEGALRDVFRAGLNPIENFFSGGWQTYEKTVAFLAFFLLFFSAYLIGAKKAFAVKEGLTRPHVTFAFVAAFLSAFIIVIASPFSFLNLKYIAWFLLAVLVFFLLHTLLGKFLGLEKNKFWLFLLAAILTLLLLWLLWYLMNQDFAFGRGLSDVGDWFSGIGTGGKFWDGWFSGKGGGEAIEEEEEEEEAVAGGIGGDGGGGTTTGGGGTTTGGGWGWLKALPWFIVPVLLLLLLRKKKGKGGEEKKSVERPEIVVIRPKLKLMKTFSGVLKAKFNLIGVMKEISEKGPNEDGLKGIHPDATDKDHHVSILLDKTKKPYKTVQKLRKKYEVLRRVNYMLKTHLKNLVSLERWYIEKYKDETEQIYEDLRAKCNEIIEIYNQLQDMVLKYEENGETNHLNLEEEWRILDEENKKMFDRRVSGGDWCGEEEGKKPDGTVIPGRIGKINEIILFYRDTERPKVNELVFKMQKQIDILEEIRKKREEAEMGIKFIHVEGDDVKPIPGEGYSVIKGQEVEVSGVLVGEPEQYRWGITDESDASIEALPDWEDIPPTGLKFPHTFNLDPKRYKLWIYVRKGSSVRHRWVVIEVREEEEEGKIGIRFIHVEGDDVKSITNGYSVIKAQEVEVICSLRGKPKEYNYEIKKEDNTPVVPPMPDWQDIPTGGLKFKYTFNMDTSEKYKLFVYVKKDDVIKPGRVFIEVREDDIELSDIRAFVEDEE